ncbi:hypothetical protein CYMTET_19282 [Cymbomonas tetramitiformis]|uniref:J domain-containing protein n=1 Tax=Cymbomonas tetramitiformis TaxID=36881 RepID=A0AAE0G6Y2_9CHLO|nr:hypothetical protein CYMTET_19282 [Cymbomonas tetramitiformis]
MPVHPTLPTKELAPSSTTQNPKRQLDPEEPTASHKQQRTQSTESAPQERQNNKVTDIEEKIRHLKAKQDELVRSKQEAESRRLQHLFDQETKRTAAKRQEMQQKLYEQQQRQQQASNIGIGFTRVSKENEARKAVANEQQQELALLEAEVVRVLNAKNDAACLGLTTQRDASSIKKAYHRLARSLHPDGIPCATCHASSSSVELAPGGMPCGTCRASSSSVELAPVGIPCATCHASSSSVELAPGGIPCGTCRASSSSVELAPGGVPCVTCHASSSSG